MDEPEIMHAGAAEGAPTPTASTPAPLEVDRGPDQVWKPPVAGEVIVDSKGRKLKLRVLTFLNEADLLEIAGPERSQNQPWIWLANLCSRVQEIDEKTYEFPKNSLLLRRVMQDVGTEGFAALVQRYAPPDDQVDGEGVPVDPGAGAKN